MTEAAPEISLLVPFYNEEEYVSDLMARLRDAMEPLGATYEIVAVDDGSSDGTARLLREEMGKLPGLVAVLFRRNFGQAAALAAAITESRGRILIPLDGDLQNDPADIPRLLAKLSEGYDVVSGWRRRRQDPFFTRILPSKIANFLISLISGVKLHDYGCTLKAYRREVLENVSLMGEMHRFIPILAPWRGARVAEGEVAHHARLKGTSKYGLGRTFKIVLDLITIKFMGSFLTKPIYVFGGSGFALVAISALLAAWTLWQKISEQIYVHRNPLFIVAIFFALAGLQLVMMGLLGELISRIYFQAGKTKPYVIQEILRAPCAESPGSP
jgi:glycosyltransferase involved in cell wall biosynthesis